MAPGRLHSPSACCSACANHLATEYWLLRIITSGEQPTRGELIRATIVRLTVLTVVAIGVAVLLWPDGIGLLLGLAIFRLIALVMTSVPAAEGAEEPMTGLLTCVAADAPRSSREEEEPRSRSATTSSGSGGLTFNIDTIFSTLVAGAHRALPRASSSRRQLTKDTEDHVPTKLQIIWEPSSAR